MRYSFLSSLLTPCALLFLPVVLEACVIAIDNSEHMRNGDYVPSRLEAQQDAVNLIAGTKTESNPESTVGVLSMSGKQAEVLVAPTRDLGKVLSALAKVEPTGSLNFSAAMAVAQLALKNRSNKNQRQRVIAFVGSPIKEDKKALEKLGKKLKKNSVAVDVVSLGEIEDNREALNGFLNAVNSNDNSHLVEVPPGSGVMSDLLVATPIVMGEGNENAAAALAAGANPSGFDMGVDPSMDPELAMALRLSMEEEQQRQAAAAGASGADNSAPASGEQQTAGSSAPAGTVADDDDLLKQAMAMTAAENAGGAAPAGQTDPMDEDEDDELALALKLSMEKAGDGGGEDDVKAALEDPNFVNNVLGTLPGVDPEKAKKEMEKKDKDKSK